MIFDYRLENYEEDPDLRSGGCSTHELQRDANGDHDVGVCSKG